MGNSTVTLFPWVHFLQLRMADLADPGESILFSRCIGTAWMVVLNFQLVSTGYLVIPTVMTVYMGVEWSL